MTSIKISEKDKRELGKLCYEFNDIFYVNEREGAKLDSQWTFDDLAEMAECGRKIVAITSPLLSE